MKPTYEQLAAAVAEAAGLKQAIDATICWQESTDAENVESIRMLLNIKTPATDAYLAEAEARGVDKFATELGHVYQQLRPGSNHAHAIKSVVFRAAEFAAQLRQGAEK